MRSKYLNEISDHPLQFLAMALVIAALCVGYLMPNLQAFAGVAIAFSVILAASSKIY
jgi:hypothetical protein